MAKGNIGFAALAMALSFAATAQAQPPTLARKAALGVAIEAGEGGALIRTVAPGSTAERAGLRAGDIVTALNGAPTPDQRVLVTLAGQLRAGDPVRFDYVRSGAPAQARATAIARPLERYDGAAARYGAVPFRGGLLRDILVTPDGARPDRPVVFLIQGYYCATMEGAQADHPYRALVQGLAARGIATYRIEKPGMGDSQGGPACLQSDFDTELDAFRQGLKTLTTVHGVRADRVVLLGHSMGGVQAPLLAAEGPPVRGVAVYGTVLRSWHDYMGDVFRLQPFVSAGVDPAAAEQSGEAMRPLLTRIFTEDTPLTKIAADNPAHAEMLRSAFEWDGGDQILARSAAYWRGVGRQRLAAAWRDAKAPTLAVYGEADFAAIDDRDHRLIADVVNHYRPGTARFVALARTGHGFGLEGDREAARAANRAGGTPSAPYNPELTKVLADWVDGLSSPPAG